MGSAETHSPPPKLHRNWWLAGLPGERWLEGGSGEGVRRGGEGKWVCQRRLPEGHRPTHPVPDPASAPGFLLTRFPARLNPRVAFRTAAGRGWGGEIAVLIPRFLLASIIEGSSYIEQTRKRGKIGEGVRKILSSIHGKMGGMVSNPVPVLPLKGGGSGLLPAVVPEPWAGVCGGKSAKAIRTFVLGH